MPEAAPAGPSPQQAPARHDVLVLGAGPAGLQLGHHLQRAGRDYLVLDRAADVGSFFETLPRSRELISFNKRHSVYDDPEIGLRWDWNSLLTEDAPFPFGEFSKRLFPKAGEMARYLRAYREAHGVRVRTDTDVTRVAPATEGGFRLTCADGATLDCRTLVVATGVSRPHVPDVPGIEHAVGYEDASFRPDDYEGQRVLVLGKGNSALELADAILPAAALVHLASPTPLRLAWKTRHPGHLRAHKTALLDAYQLKTLHGVLDCHVREIRPHGDAFAVVVEYVHADGEVEELVYDRVVRATGFRFDPAPFDEACRPALVHGDRFPEMTPLWESPTCPELFFAGTLTQANDFRRASSAFVDGFRYNARTLFHALEERHHGVPLPGEDLRAEAEALACAVLRRVCRTSSLWTQFGHLGDVLEVADDGTARLTYDLPVAAATRERCGDDYTVVTFEWGPWGGDVFAIERHPSHERADTNVFLHPVLRHWVDGELAATHHVLEDLLGMYDAPGETGTILRRSGRPIDAYHREEHVEPLRAWFAERLAARPRGDGVGSGVPPTRRPP